MTSSRGLVAAACLVAATSVAWLDPHQPLRDANKLYNEGKYDDAAAGYNAALVDHPDSADLHFNLGDATYKQGKYDEAMKTFQQVETTGYPQRASRVAYNVEPARVGQRTDFDKLTLDIETDGSIDPQAALREAAEILISSLSIFTDEERIVELRAGPGGMTALDNGGGAGAALQPGGRTGGSPMDDILIEELELGVRSYNCLKRAGIQTVGDLISKTEGELNAIPNFGKKSIDEVIETLHARGLDLRQD